MKLLCALGGLLLLMMPAQGMSRSVSRDLHANSAGSLNAAASSSVAEAYLQQGSQEGVVVSAGMKKLTMKLAEGKDHTYEVTEETKITIHGAPGKLEDLTAGMRITVIADADNKALSVSTVDQEKCMATTAGL